MPRGVDPYDEARIQGRLWTPDYQPFTEGCWDLHDLSTVTVATGISQIFDKSGKGRHMVQPTSGIQMALVGGPGGIGFGAQSTGTQYLYATTPSGSYNVSTSMAECIVYQRNAGSSGAVTDMRNTGNGTPLIDDNGSIGFGARRRNDAGTIVSTTGQTGDNNWNISTIAHDGATIYSRKNGGNTLSTNSSGTMSGINRITMNGNGFTLGGSLCNVTIASIIVVSDFTAMEKLEGHLAWKWQLFDNLSSSHRFKNRPPLIGD
jgi:hypothetical protein